MSIAMAVALIAPGGFVAAQSEADTNDLVVVATVRNAASEGDELFATAQNNMYTIDVETFHADGSPYLFTEWSGILYSIDPGNEATPNHCSESDAFRDQCIFHTWDTESEPTNEMTIRVPASSIAWGQAVPANGAAFTFAVHKDADGNSLADAETGAYPSGHLNIVANEQARNGNWGDADQSDQGFTPIFLFAAQSDGILDVGNPLMNPGFEAAAEDVDVELTHESVAPPWALYRADDSGTMVESDMNLLVADGVSGNGVSIDYDMNDQGHNAALAQFLHPPGADVGHWVGGADMSIEFDIRVTGTLTDGGNPDDWHGTASLHSDSGIARESAPGGVAVDGAWHHVTLDLGNQLDGATLTFFSLSLWTQGYDASSSIDIAFDNVEVNGASFLPDISAQRDLTDGYGAFISPMGDHLIDGQKVVQDLVSLANGETAYVYRLQGADYTELQATDLDLTQTHALEFELLDEDYLTSGGAHGGVAYGAQLADPSSGGGAFFQMVDDGQLSEDLLVVVPASALEDTADGIVPWFFADVETDDEHAGMFGYGSQPVSGYYSAAKNQLSGFTLADQLTYAATPIKLSGSVGLDAAQPTSLSLSCDTTDSNGNCLLDEGGSPAATFTVSAESPSNVLESSTVELVGPAGDVLDTASIDLPSGTASLAIPDGFDMDKQDVFARMAAGTFARAAVSDPITVFADLSDNLAPTVTVTGPNQIEPGNTISVTAEATDDGWPQPISWDVSVSPDVPLDSVTLNQDGTVTWEWDVPPRSTEVVDVDFTAFDGDLSTTVTHTVDMILSPEFVLLSPEAVDTGKRSFTQVSGSQVTLRADVHDPSGEITDVVFKPEGPTSTGIAATDAGNGLWTAPYTYATAGEYELVLEVTNDDPITETTSSTVTVVDNQPPEVNAGEDIAGQAVDASGLEVTLSGTAADPEGLAIEDADFVWTLPASAGGGTLTGPSPTATFPVGTHEVTLTVTDFHGSSASDTVTVSVDDFVTGSAVLDSASSQTEDGMYVVDDPANFTFREILGTATLVDDQGAPVAGATVNATVVYHGTQGLALAAVMQELNGTTDANGEYAFSYEHDLIDSFEGRESILSAPGYHEIEFVFTADSRVDTGIEETETATHLLRYWVGPLPPAGTL